MENGKSSDQEAEKLVHEMRALIKNKGLKVDLVAQKGAEYGDPVSASGCTGCTICSCMICW